MVEKFKQNEERWIVVYLMYINFLNEEKQHELPVINEMLLQQADALFEDLLQSNLNQSKFSLYLLFNTLHYETPHQPGEPQSLLFSLSPNAGKTNSFVFHPLNREVPGGDGISVRSPGQLGACFATIKNLETKVNGWCQPKIQLVTWGHGVAFGIFKKSGKTFNRPFHWHSLEDNTSFQHLNALIKAASVGSNAALKSQVVPGSSYQKIPPDAAATFVATKKDGDVFAMDTGVGRNAGTTPAVQVTADEPSLLTNAALATAILDGFGQRLEVLVMMNCCMMNIDTAYWLKDATRYLVAPQTTIDFPAYDYQQVMSWMNAEVTSGTKLTSEAIAGFWVTCCSNPLRRGVNHQSEISEWAIFGLRLDAASTDGPYIDQLLNCIEELAAFLLNTFKTENNERLRYLVKYSIEHCFNFDARSSLYQVDIIHWLYDVISICGLDHSRFGNKIELFKSQLLQISQQLFLKEKWVGPNWFGGQYAINAAQPPYGLSFYTPTRNIDATDEQYYNEYINPSLTDAAGRGPFSKAPSWLLLMRALRS